MCDEEQGATSARKLFFQFLDRLDVEAVGGLGGRVHGGLQPQRDSHRCSQALPVATTSVAVAGASEVIGHAGPQWPSLSHLYSGASHARAGSFVARRPS